MNNDVKEFRFTVRNDATAKRFLKAYQSFVWLNTMGLKFLYIDFSVYGTLDVIKQRKFNNLRKQSFISIPENAIQDEITRFNKRKWKRKHDSKRKPKKPKQSSRKPILHYQQERDSSPYLQVATMECDGSDINVQINTEHPIICNLSLYQNSEHNYQDLLQQDSNLDMSLMTEQTTESGKSPFSENSLLQQIQIYEILYPTPNEYYQYGIILVDEDSENSNTTTE